MTKDNRQEQLLVALEMLNNPKLPLVTEFIDQIIKQTPIALPRIANKLVTLYERCESNNLKVYIFFFRNRTFFTVP